MPTAELRRGLEALKTFRDRIDTLLAEFEGSHASPAKIAAHQISRTSFSAGTSPFPEADGLFTQYHRVHERLTSLSKSLGHQIEAMGIAVHGADVGFDNLDEEARQRFAAIQSTTKYDVGAAQSYKDGKPAQSDNTDGGGW
ncbi:hypothetical protein [Streptomyces sp. NPDC050485]|uniref:hypothetical protein n=1 Tax=Streptomyces sp. NPDC050485 TaxID=3365617 RepID=UPI0037985308